MESCRRKKRAAGLELERLHGEIIHMYAD